MTSPSTRGDNPAQAGSVDQKPGEPMPTTPDDVGTDRGEPADSATDSDSDDDEIHANYRAALDRKNSANRRGEEHRDAHGAGPARNDHSRRQFRRKSG